MEFGFLSLIPPLLAIILALITKDVVISLLLGIFSGFLILHHFHFGTAFIDLFDSLVALFAKGWVSKTILFALLVGSIIELLKKSGGVDGFVSYLSKKHIKSKKGAMLLTYITGLIIFIESSITSLLAGTISQGVYDKFGISRAKLAYICDSTSAPVCSLIPFNGWGALLIGLITAQISAHIISGNALTLLLYSIPFNFYSIITLVLVLFFIFTQKDFGPMKEAELNAKPITNNTQNRLQHKGNIVYMILPLLVLIISMPIALYLSGNGNILKGSGSTSVFYAVIVTLIFSYFLYIPTKALTHKEFMDAFFEGIAKMIPIVTILLLAFLIGNVIKELDTAHFIASIAKGTIHKSFIPALIFLISAVIAFATGTSWGTFSIMMPLAITYAASSEVYIPLAIGAVISGGIFGDHASPISDTTIISSMAAGCDHIKHVTTQLPYALLGAALALLCFIVAGILF